MGYDLKVKIMICNCARCGSTFTTFDLTKSCPICSETKNLLNKCYGKNPEEMFVVKPRQSGRTLASLADTMRKIDSMIYPKRYDPAIKDVIFNGPATIVLWKDGTKTVVKAQDGEPVDKEKGLAMAIAKKVYGNKGSYYNEFKKWID
jgi:hypothetical protein